MGNWQTWQIEMQDERWRVRIGQIQTMLSYFGSVCSVSIERHDGVTVYVQAQRLDEGLEIGAIGNGYLPERAKLSDEQVALLGRLGWSAPEPPASSNFTRTVATDEDLHEVAAGIACTLEAVYGVRGDETWVVSPPEFGQAGAGLEPFEILQPDEEQHEDNDPIRLLREASGAALAVAVASDAITFDDCLAAGLPRGERIAEMAMLYREDCPVEFLRKSAFHPTVLDDPQLPLATARAVLAARPASYELSRLGRRADIPREELLRAADRGHRLARGRGESGGDYLRLDFVPPRRLAALADQQEGEAVGILRNRRCPDDLVLRYMLARSARVRYAALAAIKRRNIPIDSALIRAARDLPMTDHRAFPYADRVRVIADQILAAR
jgi:hypothetical protein